MPQPIMIKGNLEFGIETFALHFRNQNVSIIGVMDLPWAPLKADKHFGSSVTASVNILEPEPFKFRTQAYLTREKNPNGMTMGVKFQLDEKTRAQLDKIILRYGFYPKEYARKYPRLPANPKVGSFPLRAYARSPELAQDDSAPFIFDVQNISLGGLLVASENPFAFALEPGEKLNVEFEPRGKFADPVRIESQICWTSDELNLKNRNQVRFMGLKFLAISVDSRALFLEIMKDILNRLTGLTQGAGPA